MNILLPRGSGKTNLMLKRIKEGLKKREVKFMIGDMSVYDINQEIDRLNKERVKINRRIDDLERLKNRKLSEGFKGFYTYDKDWRDLGDVGPRF